MSRNANTSGVTFVCMVWLVLRTSSRNLHVESSKENVILRVWPTFQSKVRCFEIRGIPMVLDLCGASHPPEVNGPPNPNTVTTAPQQQYPRLPRHVPCNTSSIMLALLTLCTIPASKKCRHYVDETRTFQGECGSSWVFFYVSLPLLCRKKTKRKL